MYGTFSRFAWGLALAWVIYACHQGFGGTLVYLKIVDFSWLDTLRIGREREGVA